MMLNKRISHWPLVRLLGLAFLLTIQMTGAEDLKSRIVKVTYPNGNFAKGLLFQEQDNGWVGGERIVTDDPSIDGQVFKINYPNTASFTLYSGEPAFETVTGKVVTLSLDVRVLVGPITQVNLSDNSTVSPNIDIGTAWRRISYTFPAQSGNTLDYSIKTILNNDEAFFEIDNVVLELGTVAHDPEISMVYYDGMNREIQKVTVHGNEDIVSATEFDGMGRVKRIGKSFQVAVPLDDSKFRFNYQNNAMQATNEYYSPGGPGPDADGFAFTEPIYTNDQSDRPLMKGSPGKPFSITPTLGHPTYNNYNGVLRPNLDAYQSQPYGTNEANSAYLREVATDEDGKTTIQIKDKMGNVVTTAAILGDEIHSTRSEFDVMNNKKSITSPRGLESKFRYNTLGLLEESDEPDAGIKKILYDQFGNPRLSQTSSESEAGRFIAKKYDALNRLIKIGSVSGTEKFTQANANDLNFPGNYSETFVDYHYDEFPSDGSAAALLTSGLLQEFGLVENDFRNLKGHVASVTTYNQFKSSFDENTVDGIVHKVFSYNEDGLVERSILSVRGIPSQMALYRYSEARKLKEIEITTIGGSRQIYRTEYDDVGRLQKVIDVTAANAVIAEYEYWPHGGVKNVTYGVDKIESDFIYNSRDWILGVVHKNMPSGEELFKEDLHYNVLTGIGGFSSRNFNGNISERVYAYGPSVVSANRFRISQHKYDAKNRLGLYDWGAGDEVGVLDLLKTEFDEKYSYSKDDEISGLLRGTNAHQLPSTISQLVKVNFEGIKNSSLFYSPIFGNFQSVRATIQFIGASGDILATADEPKFAEKYDNDNSFLFKKSFRMDIEGAKQQSVVKLKIRFSVVLDLLIGTTSTVTTHDIEVPLRLSDFNEKTLEVEARIVSTTGYDLIPYAIPDPIISVYPSGESDYNNFSNYAYYSGCHRLEKITGTLKNNSDPYISRDITGNFVYDSDGKLTEVKSHKIRIEYNWMDLPTKVTLGVGSTKKRNYNLYDEKGDRIAALQYTGSLDAPITVGITSNSTNYPDLPAAFSAAKDELQNKTHTRTQIYAFSPTGEFGPTGPIELFSEGLGNGIELIGVKSESDIVPEKGMRDQSNDPDLVSSKYYNRDANGILRNEIRGQSALSTKKDIISVYGLDELGRKSEGLTEVYLKNYLGSNMVVASLSEGTPKSAFDYHPHGMEEQLLVSSTAKVRPTFTGKELDHFGVYEENGQEFTNNLFHFGARYFDPEIGLWISPDPARQFASPYAYSSNPVNTVDPDGRTTLWMAGAGNYSNSAAYSIPMINKLSDAGVADVSWLVSPRNNGVFGQAGRILNTISALNGGITTFDPSNIVSSYARVGGQFNLIGYSQGAAEVANGALALAHSGKVVDNVILIAPPMSESSSTYEALLCSENIKNVQVIRIPNDPGSNTSLNPMNIGNHFHFTTNEVGQQDGLVKDIVGSGVH